MHQVFQAQADLLWPIGHWARVAGPALARLAFGWPVLTEARRASAACDAFTLAELTHRCRPSTCPR